MNEHDGLEPTAPMPRVEPAGPRGDDLPPYMPAAAVATASVAPGGGKPPPRAPLRFGNPFLYVLRRGLAFALDFVVIAGVATMLMYGLIAVNPFTGLPNNLEGGFDATLAMGVGIALLYVWLFESVLGTTLGKLAFALHVYAPKGRFVGLGRGLTRNLLRPIDALLIGLVLAILPGHRRLGDLFGGTVVANSPLRAFSPIAGWLSIAGLCAVPFFVASGPVTVVAVGAAFVQFVPPLIARSVHGTAVFLTQANASVGALTGSASASPSPSPSAASSAAAPSAEPSAVPTAAPAAAPSDAATAAATEGPTAAPTAAPTDEPTGAPSAAPADTATAAPADAPTGAPTDLPLKTPEPAATA